MPKFEGYHPVPASDWVKLHPQKQAHLRNVGGFAVNDVFLPIWRRPATTKREILLLYGTYGSGKTVDRITELVLTCVSEKYFKCYYGRQTFELAKSELHTTIIRVIEDLGLKDLFEYSKKPNGSKVISCVLNDGVFKPFGCDDEESFKGWDDPTHILVDEINQISFKSFGMLQSRLRKMNARKCFVGCFNNCDVMPDHWLRTQLLNPELNASEVMDDNGKPVQRNIIEHFSLYTDNHFIDQEDYRNSLIDQAGNDPERREAILNGLWGAATTTHPFYKNFSRTLHVQPCEYDPNLALHFSFDENVNPYLPVGVYQAKGFNIYCIDEIAAENPYNTLRWVCNELVRRYGPEGFDHKGGVYVYGDATSVKDDVKAEKGKNFFTLAKEYLEYFKPRLRVPRANPNVAMRGAFVNAVMGSNYAGMFLYVSPKCKHTIADFVNTIEAPDGSGKDKSKTTVEGVRGVQRWGHMSDEFDYFICEAFGAQYSKFQTGGKAPKWTSSPRRPHNVI